MYRWTEGMIEQLCYINRRRFHGPWPYQQGMQGSSYAYYNPNQNAYIPSWAPLLIPPGLHLLPGLLHLSTIPSWPTNHFSHILVQNLIGMHHPKGGSPHTKMLQLYCIHLHLNHNFYTLLHLNNLICLPNQTRTWTTDRHNRYTVERKPTLLMPWKFRISTLGLGECSQITKLHLHLGRVRRKERKLCLEWIHYPFLKG